MQTALDQAVLDPLAWRLVCDRLADALGGVGAVLVPEAVENQTRGVVASQSLTGLMDTIFRDGWVSRNYRRRAIPVIKARGFGTDLDIADETVMRREPFYTELLASQKLGVFIGLNTVAGNQTFVATVERSEKAQLPDEHLFDRARVIIPMLGASVRASHAIAAGRQLHWKELAAETTQALFVIDRQGRVIDRTPGSEALIGPVVRLGQRQLEPVLQRARAPFATLLAAAVAGENGRALPRPVFVETPGFGTMMFEAVPLPASLRYFHSTAAAIVTVRAVDDDHADLMSLLRKQAGLTEAELRLALALFDGHSLAEHAVRAGIAVGTVRQQVKSVFRKTGTGRQAELVTLMRRLNDGDAG